MNITISVSNADKHANDLLKLATKKRGNGQYEEAISILKRAFVEIQKIGFDYSVNVFLRLPMYLQEANRPDEAWQEYINLLEKGYPNQNRKKELIPMTDAEIYDKMRLFLQRENKANEAVSCGIYSIILQFLGLYLQGRISVSDFNSEYEYLSERIKPLLKKAKRLDLLDSLINIVISELKKLPNISKYSEFKETLDI